MPARVMIVEDEWLIAEDYSSVLRDAGHEIVGPYASLNAALAAVEGSKFDAALLDMDLRGEKTFLLAEQLQEQHIPFTFVSGHGPRELPDRLKDCRILEKPTDRSTLLAVIEQMIREA